MKKQNNPFENYVRYSSIALQMLVIIALGVGGGVLLDKEFNLKFPVCTVILSVFSVFVAIYIAVKDFIKKK